MVKHSVNSDLPTSYFVRCAESVGSGTQDMTLVTDYP